MNILEESEYVHIEKQFVQKKSLTMISLTEKGHQAFKEYKQGLLQALNDLPD